MTGMGCVVLDFGSVWLKKKEVGFGGGADGEIFLFADCSFHFL